MTSRYVGATLFFVVPGEPVAWARARRRGSHYFVSNAQKQAREAMALTARRYLSEMPAPEQALFRESPVEVEVVGYFEPPTSWPKWKREASLVGSVLKTTKPDSDNLVKLVKDALEGVVWSNDSHVVDQIGRKRYATMSRTEVTIRRLAWT